MKILTAGFLLCLIPFGKAQDLKTRWAAGVTPANAWREYPRPQMVRKDWVNLNGTWKVSFDWGQRSLPPSSDVLVPFPIESQLSGVHRALVPQGILHYQRSFEPPTGERVLLHVGAADWHARVWVNQQAVGEHRGGYDPFSF